MLFNSIPFAFFFIIVVSLFFAIPHRFRWILLLIASYYFYMCWKAEYVLLIMLTTLVDFFMAKHIATVKERTKRRKFIVISLIYNMGILVGFKYFNFFSASVTGLLSQFNIFVDAPVFKVLLPVGVSFYTFQSLSYLLDVYNDRIKPERHLGYYALYVSFWPQLVAGPIERTGHLMPQFKQPQVFDANRVTSGLRLMLLGLFKKIAIADQVAVYVNIVYNHLEDYQTLPVMVATFFFAIQIYCDFSGYTDIARGAARVMGYDLMENFRRPYFAMSIHNFWRRWHISLSTWFRDYVYVPLGGNRGSKWQWNKNLLITFFLSGLWHGANWTFVVWGAVHGCCLVVENLLDEARNRFFPGPKNDHPGFPVRVLKTMVAMLTICFAWIFFRANSLGDAMTVISKIFSFTFSDSAIAVVGPVSFARSIILIIVLFVVDILIENNTKVNFLNRIPLGLRWSVYMAGVWTVIFSAIFGVQQQFIYFQF